MPYLAGKRAMEKIKRDRTADCVVAGYREVVGDPGIASLLLGLYDDAGVLHHIGVASSFTKTRRRELIGELAPTIVPLEGHPWENGFLVDGNPIGRLHGSASRWSPREMERDWIPLRPELVCEVAFDQVDERKLRHPARFRRWRPDRDARSCTIEQLDVQPPAAEEVLSR